MEQDWHTYWVNAGDSGMATSLKWAPPPGFTAGPILWPYPDRLPKPPVPIRNGRLFLCPLDAPGFPARVSPGNFLPTSIKRGS